MSLAALLPLFHPTNIFTAHPSNTPSTSTATLFTRLSTVRPLTSTEDTELRAALSSKSGRLLYYALGPDALTTCPFCSPAELENPGATTIPLSYLIYQLPAQLTPHILQLAVLGLVTTSLLGGRAAARWRSLFLTLALGIAAADVYLLATYDVRATNTTLRPGSKSRDIDFFHWRLRTYRFAALAAVDLLLAATMYLMATNRLFLTPPSIAERVQAITRVAEATNSRIWAAGIVRNTVGRSAELRAKEGAYWEEERGLWEEREVLAAVRGALGRVDMRQLGLAAQQRAEAVVGGLMVPPGVVPGG